MPFVPHDPEEFTTELAPAQLLISANGRSIGRGRRIVGVVTGFLLGQGMSQSIVALAGLFLVRRLSIDAYAQFGLATAFQGVFATLMDLGFATTIVPLVGERRDDRALIGRYVRAAQHMRNRSFQILAPVASLAFLWIVHKYHWSMRVQLLLLASVLLSLYSGGKVSYFSAPLFVFGRLREYYVPQILTGAGRILAYFGLAMTGCLNSWTAAGLGAINITVNGSWIGKASRKYFDWPTRDDRNTERELLRYILPASPAIVFSAFQAQISLFLLSVFGGGMQFIAEVTALARIGQIFIVLTTFNTIVVEPYIARVSRDRLYRIFTTMLVLVSLACVPLVLIGFVWPNLFVWVLGTKYGALKEVMGLYILSCCMNLISGTIWIMNRGRKWVFWSGSILEVVLVLLAQTVFLIVVGVNNTREAVLLNVVSSCCYLVAHGYVSIYGFLKGPRAETVTE